MNSRDENALPKGAFSSRPWKPAALSLLGFVLFCLFGASWIEGFNLRWMDASLRLRRNLGWAPALVDQIRIVELDDQDLAEIGSGGEYAAAAATIGRLSQLGARAIVVDVLYSRGSADQQQLIRDAIREAHEEFGTRFVLPAVIYRENDRAGIRKSLALSEGEELDFGVINMAIDPDRLWRHYSLTHVFEGATYPSLALAAFATTLPSGIEFVPGERPGVLKWTELSEDYLSSIPRQAGSKARLLNFRDSYFSDEVDQKAGLGRRIWNVRDFNELRPDAGTLSGSPFQGAVAFFGYGRGLDEKATSMGPQEPGVFLHAIALSDLVQGNFLRRTRPWQDFLMMTLLVAIAIGLFQVEKKRWLFFWAVAGLAVIAGVSVSLIWSVNLVPAFTTTAALWSLLIFVEIGRRHSVELVERIRLHTTMGFYFSDRVLEHVRENPGSTEPKEAELTILITDIRNFTTLCEMLPPKEMFSLLSRTFGVQTAAAISQDGSLQHFWGDQFLAYWGAPEPQPDAADRALKSVEALTRELSEFRSELPGNVADLFDVGIGLHCGIGLVGNMGSESYLDYSVFGDVVNSAARVESLTKTYGVSILVTRQFFDALSSPPPWRVIDHVFVAGKRDQSLELIQLALKADLDSFHDLTAQYERAFALYQKGKFEEAERNFLRLRDAFDDRPSEVLAKRCRRLKEAPPEHWAGIYRLSQKDAAI